MPYTTLESLTPIQRWLLFNVATKSYVSRTNLVQASKFPRTTVYDNLAKLQKRKLVTNNKYHKGKRGRPITMWTLTEFGYQLLREGEIDE